MSFRFNGGPLRRSAAQKKSAAPLGKRPMSLRAFGAGSLSVPGVGRRGEEGRVGSHGLVSPFRRFGCAAGAAWTGKHYPGDAPGVKYPSGMKRTALITGAADGIGLEVAKTLAQRGYRVLLTARTLQRASEGAAHGPQAPRRPVATAGSNPRWG